jgi:peptidoglycan hydrolase-like protein with peptidoglycan-binding domain
MKAHIFNRIALGIVAAATLVTPGLAAAESSDTQMSSSTASSIQSILAQIHALQEQLNQLAPRPPESEASASSTEQHRMTGEMDSFMGPSSPRSGHLFCLNLARSLSMGSRGSDVSDLQTSLSQDSSIYPEGKITGFFGPATAAAVMRLQEHLGVASSSSATGTVGPKTREHMRGECAMPGAMRGAMGSTTPWMMGTTSMWMRDLPGMASSTHLLMPPYLTASTTMGLRNGDGENHWMMGSSTGPATESGAQGHLMMPPMPPQQDHRI